MAMQQQQQGTTSEGFKPVAPGGETHSGGTLLVEAYAVLWILLMGWLFLLWRKQAAIHERLDGLEREIDKAASQRK